MNKPSCVAWNLNAALVCIAVFGVVSVTLLTGQPLSQAFAQPPVAAAQPTSAVPTTTWTVTSTADSGPGTLREAIASANSGDTIDFDLTYPAAITLTSQALTITKDIAIHGPGAANLTVSGNNAHRVFYIIGTVTVSSVTIADGNALGSYGGGLFIADKVWLDNVAVSNNWAAQGGGLINYGILTMTNSLVSGNLSTVSGGGVANYGMARIVNSTFINNTATDAFNGGAAIMNNSVAPLNLLDSTIANNESAGVGGGLYNYAGTVLITGTNFTGNLAHDSGGGIYNYGAVELNASTFMSNTAANFGGGIDNRGNTVTVNNSTLSVNTAYYGGGIDNSWGTLTVTNSTLSSNLANLGGGINNEYGTTMVQNSIVALQISGLDCLNFDGTITSQGYNIESDTSCGFAGTGDQQNVLTDTLKLKPLANNGGPTWTRSLGSGSVALNQIPTGTNGCGTSITADQRGVPRPIPSGGKCDIGAFEDNTLWFYLPMIRQ